MFDVFGTYDKEIKAMNVKVNDRLSEIVLTQLETLEDDLKELSTKERLNYLTKLLPYVALSKSQMLKEKPPHTWNFEN